MDIMNKDPNLDPVPVDVSKHICLHCFTGQVQIFYRPGVGHHSNPIMTTLRLWNHTLSRVPNPDGTPTLIECRKLFPPSTYLNLFVIGEYIPLYCTHLVRQ